MIDLFFFVSAGVFNLELDAAFLRGGFAGLSPLVDTLFSLCSEDFPAGGSWVFALEACSLLALVPSTSWGVMRRRFFVAVDCSSRSFSVAETGARAAGSAW